MASKATRGIRRPTDHARNTLSRPFISGIFTDRFVDNDATQNTAVTARTRGVSASSCGRANTSAPVWTTAQPAPSTTPPRAQIRLHFAMMAESPSRMAAAIRASSDGAMTCCANEPKPPVRRTTTAHISW